LQRINNKPKAKLTRNFLSHHPLGQWLGLVGLVVLFITYFLSQPLAASSAADTAVNEKYQACAECHDDMAASLKMGVHGLIDKKGLAHQANAQFSCESCHGDITKHLEEPEAGNIFAFKTGDKANMKSNRCLICHKDNHADYFASSHGKAALDCSSCHTVHGKANKTLLKESRGKVCLSCHEDVQAKFQLNEHHRLPEGSMDCMSCHDPHKPATRERLAGFKQETCYKCHTDKQGPYLYEHASVRVEGCTVCHDVHGSPNRHLLINQSVSELCYSCHNVVPGWHSRFTPATNCASCHFSIHGSHLSPKFLK